MVDFDRSDTHRWIYAWILDHGNVWDTVVIRFFFGPIWWVAVVLALLWSPFLIARLIDAPM